MVRVGLVAAVLLLLAGCSGRKHNGDGTAARRAFYYWQTDAGRFWWSDSTYRALHVDRVYGRAFDVDWSDEAAAPVPVSPMDYFYYLFGDDSADVVPVVFITNEVFTHLDSTGIRQLAKNIDRKLRAGISAHQSAGYYSEFAREGEGLPEVGPYRQKSRHFREQQEQDSIMAQSWTNLKGIQFDCDWTKRTRKNYFAFLRECRKLFPGKQLSATIRLYPYKYPQEAGVPPVDRGMLMCYNAGDVRNVRTPNSIFDRKEVMSYLKDADVYPLPLDYALPIFEWAVLYRDSVFKSILPARLLQEDYATSLTREPGSNHATVTHDFVLGYTSRSPLLRQGDMIRFERPAIDDVEQVATWLSDHKNNNEATLTFYHLNGHDLHEYATALEAMYSTF